MLTGLLSGMLWWRTASSLAKDVIMELKTLFNTYLAGENWLIVGRTQRRVSTSTTTCQPQASSCRKAKTKRSLLQLLLLKHPQLLK